MFASDNALSDTQSESHPELKNKLTWPNLRKANTLSTQVEHNLWVVRTLAWIKGVKRDRPIIVQTLLMS